VLRGMIDTIPTADDGAPSWEVVQTARNKYSKSIKRLVEKTTTRSLSLRVVERTGVERIGGQVQESARDGHKRQVIMIVVVIVVVIVGCHWCHCHCCCCVWHWLQN